MLYFLFFLIPLRLRQYSTRQGQLGCPVADKKPSSIAPLVTQTSPDHHAIGTGSCFSQSLVIICRLCGLQYNSTDRFCFFPFWLSHMSLPIVCFLRSFAPPSFFNRTVLF
jgi:hypothetical protein